MLLLVGKETRRNILSFICAQKISVIMILRIKYVFFKFKIIFIDVSRVMFCICTIHHDRNLIAKGRSGTVTDKCKGKEDVYFIIHTQFGIFIKILHPSETFYDEYINFDYVNFWVL